MPEAVRYGNAGCVVHGPRGLRTRVTALFSGVSGGRADLAAAAPAGGADRRPVPPILCPRRPSVGNPAAVAPEAGHAPAARRVRPRHPEHATSRRAEGAHRGGRQAEVVRPA